MNLTSEEKKQLIQIALASIHSSVKGEPLPVFEPNTETLRQLCGAFVTIHKKGALRGCIGYVEGIKPLHEAVTDMARAAALEDPRFPPVSADELDSLDIEISVLSPTKRIDDVSQIEVGKHGIIIQRGMYKGLLLPQVATEYGWDTTTFLEHTCQKAGLPTNAWQDDETVIKIFSAIVFGEKDFA